MRQLASLLAPPHLLPLFIIVKHLVLEGSAVDGRYREFRPAPVRKDEHAVVDLILDLGRLR